MQPLSEFCTSHGGGFFVGQHSEKARAQAIAGHDLVYGIFRLKASPGA